MVANAGGFRITAPRISTAYVTITNPNGGIPTLYSDANCTTTITMPYSIPIGATQYFYVAPPGGTYTLSVKFGGSTGTEIASPSANTTTLVDLSGGEIAAYDHTNTTVASTSASSLLPGLSVGRPGANTPVGTVANFFGNLLSNGTDTSGCYRLFTPISDTANTTILPVFNNQPNATNIVGDGQVAPNSITVAAALELADGTVIPYTFGGGSHTVTITSGSQLAIPDFPIAHGGLTTDAGWGLPGVYLRTYVTASGSATSSTGTTVSGNPVVTDAAAATAWQGRLITGTGIPNNTYVGTVIAGTSYRLSTRSDSQVDVNASASGTPTVTIKAVWPLNYGVATNSIKSNGTNGADLTLLNSAGGSSGFTTNANSYGPCLVLGDTKVRKPIVASITDSIFNGTTDQMTGPVARAASTLGFPHVKLSKVSETAGSLTTAVGRRFRSVVVPGCTHAVIELGTNDGVDTLPKATTLQASLTSMITWLTGQGIKVWLCTVPPKLNSTTDGYATIGGQTVYNIPTALVQINSWIRSVPAGASGFIELNTPVSSGQDSSFWAQHPRGRQVSDMATTSGSAAITSATAAFTAADVGLGIFIAGGQTNSSVTILSVQSATAATMSANASATVSGAVAGIGAWYATSDGTHPSTAMMVGGILTNVQAAMSTFTV